MQIKHSLPSASSVANVLFSRATLANWVVSVSRDWLQPLASCIKKRLLSGAVIYCDETPFHIKPRRTLGFEHEAELMFAVLVYRSVRVVVADGRLEPEAAGNFEKQPNIRIVVQRRCKRAFHGRTVADHMAVNTVMHLSRIFAKESYQLRHALRIVEKVLSAPV